MTSFLSRKIQSKWVKVVGIVGSILLFLLLTHYFDIAELQKFMHQHKESSLLISYVCYVLLSFTFIPTAPLIIFMSFFSNPLSAAVIAVLGNTTAAIIQYYIGSSINDQPQFEEWQNKLPASIRKFPVDSPLFLIIARFMPGGPRVFSFLCGARNIPFRTYLWASALAYTISASFFAFGGDWITNLI